MLIEELSIGQDGSLTILDGKDWSSREIGEWKYHTTNVSVRSTGNQVYLDLGTGNAASSDKGLFLTWTAGTIYIVKRKVYLPMLLVHHYLLNKSNLERQISDGF